MPPSRTKPATGPGEPGAAAVPPGPRVDAELVRRGLARSREHAAALVADGRVSADGRQVRKPAQRLRPAADLVAEHDPADPGFASRAGHKLAGALAAFGPHGPGVHGRRCLDVGASTGGFTDVLLRAGAAEVVCVDVGSGQLMGHLRADPRTAVLEGRNVRDLTPADLGDRPGLVVADLSFISLVLVLPVLADVADPDGDLVLMVKPQFEVGRDGVGEGGVVTDPELRRAAVHRVADAAHTLGLGVRGVTRSVLPGPAGNVEYFLWLASGPDTTTPGAIDRVVSAPGDGEKVSW
jgi:23S rRNA (cytidine1920-2'-O)/16S rRNA (cytidine1409-2'-O)-methyltransferase